MMAVSATRSSELAYAMGLARACAGAMIFGLPLLMTMEMWFLGAALHPGRLLVFLGVNFVILVGLSRFGGFERTVTVAEDVMDALAAVGVGIIASAAILALLGIVAPGMPLDEIAGKVAIQSVPMSFGAMVARKQLGVDEPEKEDELRGAGYGAELFLMLTGALFLSFNVAPTEEMSLIAFMMSTWQLILLALFSILALHLLVYGVGLSGQEEHIERSGTLRTVLHYTIPGYGIAIMVGCYVLWTFGRIDDTAIDQVAATVAVLALPGALGAAIARLVV